MHRRPLRRATILALTGLLAFAGTAMADQLLADGDLIAPGIQGTKPLGNVPAGGEVSVDVQFALTCVGINHADLGQSVVLGWSGVGSAPVGGAIVSVTPATIGPVTAAWAPDVLGCPDPVPSMVGSTLSHVTLRAPTTAGNGYMYTIVYDRSLSPAGLNDANAFSRTATQVSFTLNVIANTPPTLTVPSSISVEGNTTGGWTADWSGVSATDPEDNPDPTPACNPTAGSVLSLGLTTVSCWVTDSGGARATGAFDVTVVDTTTPVLSGMPGDRSLTTDDPSGESVTYTSPTATDIVDSAPDVACAPASGTTFPVGTTEVTCTATDASGNHSGASVTVEVRFVAPHYARAIWLEPVGDGQDAFAANHSRTIPLKVRLFVDGVERSSGQAQLTLTPCGGGTTALELPLSWGSGRWNAALDTSVLPGACYTVTASIGDQVAGSFQLELRGEASPAKSNGGATSTAQPKKTGHGKPR
jgi:hypothetical protein